MAVAPVFLGDIWPSSEEVHALMKAAMPGKAFRENYERVKNDPGKLWEKIKGVKGNVYTWPQSTYIAEPPFFDGFALQAPEQTDPGVRAARIMALFGDSITTDHISPAGSIAEASPAGQWLLAHGVQKADFNSACTSSLEGQMSPRYTACPRVPKPTGSVIRSRSTVPAMA